MTSDLVTSNTSPSGLDPGSTQYMLSLAQVALSASVEIPELWGCPHLTSQLLQCLLRCPLYEVRELVLERVLRRLQEEEEEKKRPQWLDETTLSNLTCLALHENHPQCLAKVRPHTHTHAHKSIIGTAVVCCVCVCSRACANVFLFYRCACVCVIPCSWLCVG